MLISVFSFAQNDSSKLNFNTKYYDAVDKWIAFPLKNNDTTYTFGFIYLDEHAGFTFDYSSRFVTTDNGLKVLPREFEAGLKSRLSPNTVLVAILTENQIADLELPSKPDWLSIYKENSGKVSYLKNIGFNYNHVSASNLALKSLRKAYKIEPHYDGLEFELAYAYNALKQFNKAIPILENAIKNNPKNFYFYRELGYAYKHIDEIEQAEKTYKKGIRISKNEF